MACPRIPPVIGEQSVLVAEDIDHKLAPSLPTCPDAAAVQSGCSLDSVRQRQKAQPSIRWYPPSSQPLVSLSPGDSFCSRLTCPSGPWPEALDRQLQCGTTGIPSGCNEGALLDFRKAGTLPLPPARRKKAMHGEVTGLPSICRTPLTLDTQRLLSARSGYQLSGGRSSSWGRSPEI